MHLYTQARTVRACPCTSRFLPVTFGLIFPRMSPQHPNMPQRTAKQERAHRPDCQVRAFLPVRPKITRSCPAQKQNYSWDRGKNAEKWQKRREGDERVGGGGGGGCGPLLTCWVKAACGEVGALLVVPSWGSCLASACSSLASESTGVLGSPKPSSVSAMLRASFAESPTAGTHRGESRDKRHISQG